MEWLDNNFGLENVISRAPIGYKERVMRQWPSSSPDMNPLDFGVWPWDYKNDFFWISAIELLMLVSTKNTNQQI